MLRFSFFAPANLVICAGLVGTGATGTCSPRIRQFCTSANISGHGLCWSLRFFSCGGLGSDFFGLRLFSVLTGSSSVFCQRWHTWRTWEYRLRTPRRNRYHTMRTKNSDTVRPDDEHSIRVGYLVDFGAVPCAPQCVVLRTTLPKAGATQPLLQYLPRRMSCTADSRSSSVR